MTVMFKSAQSKYQLLPNGIMVVPDAGFRAIAACRPSTGEYFVADGKRWEKDFTATVQHYQKRDIFPPMAANKVFMVTMEEISNLYLDATITQTEEVQSSDRTLQKLIQTLEDAALARASDLKITQRSNKTTVRVKVAGREFNLGRPWTVFEGQTVMSMLFDRRDEGGGDTSNVVIAFQSFALSPNNRIRLPKEVIKLRGQKGYHETASGPGQHMILRLFYSDEAQQETATLEALGFDGSVYEALARVRRSLHGAVIIGGATGDGKSTTLARCLTEQYHEHKGQISIVTIEDPVEYKMNKDGIIQIPVKSSASPEKRKEEYRKALMHFVRINPDVGCISEIRDHDAAREVLQFVDTGHQVWTTIHVNSANGILFRLIDMGVSPTELAKPDAISLLMKQTLVPFLCPDCSIPLGRAEESSNLTGSPQSWSRYFMEHFRDDFHRIRLRNRAGCETCCIADWGNSGQQAWSGYERQVAVAEHIEPDIAYLRLVRKVDMIGARDHWLKPREEGGLGGFTIVQKIEKLVREGKVDPNDAVRKGWRSESPDLRKSKQPDFPIILEGSSQDEELPSTESYLETIGQEAAPGPEPRLTRAMGVN